MKSSLDRRTFLKKSVLGATGLSLLGHQTRSFARSGSPNDKLNIGFVGTAGQAGFSLQNLQQENIVALCDIDDTNLAKAKERFPQAATYNDFRRLIDQPGIDAIVVAIPDHTHAVAAVAALRSGRHLYCEKPLARTISEARIITETAHKYKRVTQIGTQIHAGSNYRRVVELVQSGAIGPVHDVHVWVNAIYGNKPKPKPAPVPPNIHYDLWLGPVEDHPYSPEFVPFHWRNWWAFGGGSLADFGCHYMDLPHWALDLRTPLSAEPVKGPPVDPDAPPPQLIVRYEYPPARAGKGAVTHSTSVPLVLTWYHGGEHPDLIGPDLYPNWKSGVLFVGSKGMLLADDGKHKLLPEKDFADFVPPAKFIPDSIGHHKEWVYAIKMGGKTTCNFDYSGPLTEAALLGNVAYRVQKKLQWDPKHLRATNAPEADQYIQHHYRSGWSI